MYGYNYILDVNLFEDTLVSSEIVILMIYTENAFSDVNDNFYGDFLKLCRVFDILYIVVIVLDWI